MISMSVKVSESNERKQLALQKAHEALEFFRKERSVNSWHNFSTPLINGSSYCVSTMPEEISSMSAKLGTCADSDILEAARYEFKRQALINFNSNDSVKITVDLDWYEGAKAKNLSLEQDFDNY